MVSLQQMQTSWFQWIRSIPRPILILILGGFINSTGSALLWPLNTIYIHNILGKSLTTAGFVLMLMNGAGIIGSMVGGYLYDRIGGKKVIIVSLMGVTIILYTMAITQNWYVYLTGMTLLGLLQSSVWPALNALVGSLWPEGGRRAFNMLYVTNNAGVAVGTALGGLLAAISFSFVFAMNATSVIVYIVFVLIGIRVGSVTRTNELAAAQLQTGAPSVTSLPLRTTLSLWGLAIGMLLSWMAYSQWQGAVAVQTQLLGYPLSSYSLLWTINGVLIVGMQPLLLPFIRRYLKQVSRQIVWGAGLYAISFAIITWSPTYLGFITGMIILTIGEMLILPGIPAAVNEAVPVERVGTFQGLIGSAGTAGRMAGPVLGGFMFDQYSVTSVFLMATIFSVLSWIILLVRAKTPLSN